jgi:hypothetical protein
MVARTYLTKRRTVGARPWVIASPTVNELETITAANNIRLCTAHKGSFSDLSFSFTDFCITPR